MVVGSVSRAAITPALSLANTTGDAVQVKVTGDPNSSIQLSVLSPGASTVTNIGLGATDGSGNFSSIISSGGYNIPSGSPAFITINGLQSATVLWPTYTSTLTLSQTNLSLAVGQSTTITAPNALVLAANSNSTVLAVVINGNQATISGSTAGSGTVTFCSASVGCNSVAVVVGGQNQGQARVSVSQNVVVLNSAQTQNISIYGGPSGGYIVSTNSNPTAVSASISGMSSVLTIFGNNTPGTATVTVCAAAANTNCATVNVTVLNNSAGLLSFSQNNVALVPGQTSSVTVSGGSGNSYYISSNSNSGVVAVSLSGSVVNLVGGASTGQATVSVCSTVVNATCGNIYVTTTATPGASSSTLAFSQNVVTVYQGSSSNVTVSGGMGPGYLISTNSNPSVVTASIVGGSNIVTLLGGNATGSAIITVCSVSSGASCASLYVTVSPPLVPISFSQNNLVLALGQALNLSVIGGSGNFIISSNSNPNSITATISASSTVLAVHAGSTPGNASLSVCDAGASTNCGTLYLSVGAPTSPVSTPAAVTPTVPAAPQPASSSVASSAVVFHFTRFLTVGSVGADVRELQKRLVAENLLKVAPTGKFGALTKAAVKLFQKKNDLPAVGYVGPATRNLLNQ